MIFKALTTNERAENEYTHIGIITADDLTNTTVAAAQTIEFCKLAAGDQIMRVAWHLKTPFQNTADAAFNTTTASVGDVAAVATHLAAAETNLNGTEIIWRTGNTTVLYLAADKFAITFNSMAAKALSSLNRGELIIFCTLCRMRFVSDAQAATSISKT